MPKKIEYLFVVDGDSVIKKNSQKVSFRSGRPFVYRTAKYKSWEESALYQLRRQRINYKINKSIEKCHVKINFFPATHRRFDLTNMAEGIMDCLVKEEIIKDDSWKIVPKVSLQIMTIDKRKPKIIACIKES